LELGDFVKFFVGTGAAQAIPARVGSRRDYSKTSERNLAAFLVNLSDLSPNQIDRNV